MATNISGLFGDVTRNPQDYRNEALQGLMVSPAQMGSQGLYQQLISTMGNAGASIGSIGGGLLGGKTAGEVRDSKINDAMQRVSQGKYDTEWAKLDALAKDLAGQGMNAEAEKASNRSAELKIQDLNVRKAEKSMQPEQFKDFKRVVMVSSNPFDPNAPLVEKTITETLQWDEAAKQYVKPGSVGKGGDAVGGEGGQGGEKTETLTPQQKAQQILEQRKNTGTYTNPVATSKMPQGNPIPPSLRYQNDYGGTQGLINPEGY